LNARSSANWTCSSKPATSSAFTRSFEDIEEIYIPTVYWDFTSKSVLVMEHIEGIKMDRVDEIRRQGIDPQEVAMIGLRSFSRQLMAAGIFHADPHPGNTLVMPDGRVSLVDFGIVGYLDEETMMQIAHLFLGFAEHDYDMVMEAFEAAGLVDPHHGPESLPGGPQRTWPSPFTAAP
jgi:ubiquinone biosynthesis protein